MLREDECWDKAKVWLERDDGDGLGWVWGQGARGGLGLRCMQASQMWPRVQQLLSNAVNMALHGLLCKLGMAGTGSYCGVDVTGDLEYRAPG